MELMTVHREWASRPDDERYLSLEDMDGAASAQRAVSREITLAQRDLYVTADGDDVIATLPGDKGGAVSLSHWAFGQLATRAGAPAGYLRDLPAPLAAVNLAWGLERGENNRDSIKLLVQGAPGDPGSKIRAATGDGYGRVWDTEVIRAIEDAIDGGEWVVPAASYTGTNPKRATTLYRGDRSMFAFLMNPHKSTDIGGGASLYRGFCVWNSEVRDRSLGVTTVSFNTVCDNRIIWGASGVETLRIRHTSGAPYRFAQELRPALRAYVTAEDTRLIAAVAAARQKQIADDTKGAESWLQARGFTQSQSATAMQLAARPEAGGGDPLKLWDMVQGLTAYAREISHADDRLDFERKAGKLLDLVKV